MKYLKRYILLSIALLAALIVSGCQQDELADYRETDYGYVQFKLYRRLHTPVQGQHSSNISGMWPK